MRTSLLLDDAAIEAELLALTDRHTDEIFTANERIASRVVCTTSRLVVDVERFTDDAHEAMAARGMGAVYTRGSLGQPLRFELSPIAREALLERFYEPHHRRLNDLTTAALATIGSALIIDCHSLPSRPLPCDLDQSPSRPDICLGTDAVHTPQWLLETAADRFAAAGLSTRVNAPYSGTMVAAEHMGDPYLNSLMIEVNRSLYMDETTGAKAAGFDDVANVVRGVVISLCKEHSIQHR